MLVLRDNHPMLSMVCEEVEHGSDVTELVESMKCTMTKHGGIGLAANQVGVLKRIIVMKVPKYKGCVINPVITRHVKNTIVSTEGCLSVPGKRVDMKRYNKIVLEGFDENWNPLKLDLNGKSAFCAQHEIDHLNGITIDNQKKG